MLMKPVFFPSKGLIALNNPIYIKFQSYKKTKTAHILMRKSSVKSRIEKMLSGSRPSDDLLSNLSAEVIRQMKD